jgi:hypothetical protein
MHKTLYSESVKGKDYLEELGADGEQYTSQSSNNLYECMDWVHLAYDIVQ